MLLCYKSFWILLLQELYLPLLVTQNALYNVMGVKRHIMPVDLPQSVSISGDEINLTVRAVSTGVLCCNLAERKSMLKMCISKHCHEVTGFFLWVGTYCISCVVQQKSRVKDLLSQVGYDDSCLAAIRHVKSIVRVIQPRPNTRSHSVLLLLILQVYKTVNNGLIYLLFGSYFPAVTSNSNLNFTQNHWHKSFRDLRPSTRDPRP